MLSVWIVRASRFNGAEMNYAAGVMTTAGGKVSVMTQDSFFFVTVTKGKKHVSGTFEGSRIQVFEVQKLKKKISVDLRGCSSQAHLF